MSSSLDVIIDSLTKSSSETPQELLRSWLNLFYSKTANSGLSSSQLGTIIQFVCTSPILSVTTRLYIIENCLLPNDYLSRGVINVVISHLGMATAISKFRLQTPKKIQVALCKWLVHVYFLLPPDLESEISHLDSSVWLHLWQFDYLQHWLTYIVVWSTVSPRDVKRWKVTVLKRVASKPNYRNAIACATLILKRYETIAGRSELISQTISSLKCNARRLKSLQFFTYDQPHIAKLRKMLLTQSPSKFTETIFHELVSSSLNQLYFQETSNKTSLVTKELESREISLYDLNSLNSLAWSWENTVVPLDVERIFNDKRSASRLYVLALPKEHKFWTISYEWICVSLNRCFSIRGLNSSNEMIKDTVQNILKVCQMYPSLIPPMIDAFFNLHYLEDNPSLFLNLFTRLFALQIYPNDLPHFKRKVLEILAFTHLNKSKGTQVFTELANAIIFMIRNWVQEDTTAPSGLQIIQGIQPLLVSNSHNTFENRRVTILLITVLKTLPHARVDSNTDSNLKYLILPYEMIERLFIGDDPMLLDACCNYLINTKRFLLDKKPTNTYVQRQNAYILDLTNYLWRNKVHESRSFLKIPTKFVLDVIDNLYLPNAESKAKAVFSITSIPALSYASTKILQELEVFANASVNYSELINDEGFKKFFKSLFRRQLWIQDISNFSDLKVEILKTLANCEPYKNIAFFLFTYLKSLSKYNSQSR